MEQQPLNPTYAAPAMQMMPVHYVPPPSVEFINIMDPSDRRERSSVLASAMPSVMSFIISDQVNHIGITPVFAPAVTTGYIVPPEGRHPGRSCRSSYGKIVQRTLQHYIPNSGNPHILSVLIIWALNPTDTRLDEIPVEPWPGGQALLTWADLGVRLPVSVYIVTREKCHLPHVKSMGGQWNDITVENTKDLFYVLVKHPQRFALPNFTPAASPPLINVPATSAPPVIATPAPSGRTYTFKSLDLPKEIKKWKKKEHARASKVARSVNPAGVIGAQGTSLAQQALSASTSSSTSQVDTMNSSPNFCFDSINWDEASSSRMATAEPRDGLSIVDTNTFSMSFDLGALDDFDVLAPPVITAQEAVSGLQEEAGVDRSTRSEGGAEFDNNVFNPIETGLQNDNLNSALPVAYTLEGTPSASTAETRGQISKRKMSELDEDEDENEETSRSKVKRPRKLSSRLHC